MKNAIFSLLLILTVTTHSYSQIQIVQENFGTVASDVDPAAYPDYTSDAIFSGDSPHTFTSASSEGYAEASGGVAVLMGNWTVPANTEFVMQYNTEGYNSIRLSFGIKHNSGGWGTCQLTNNYTQIEYSTDNTNWTTIDKAALLAGSYWPCADDGNWSYVELSEVLPSNATLSIRFTHTDPVTHPYYLDDITLTGYLPDYNPPTAPSNLSAENIDFNSCILVWTAASDDNAINYYEIYKNGFYLMSTADTVVNIKYQSPESIADFTIIAYDIGVNASPVSPILQVTFLTKPVDHQYSWETPQADILPNGDIEWNPLPFEYEPGSSIRYIDYEGGDDTNNGLTKLTAWKNHPWDVNANANAANCTGIHTYVFKRGVVYRGTLEAKESGSPLEPIRLTSDPSWGSGEAYFFGSQRITSGWTLADANSAPNIPDPGSVWYIDVALPETKIICELDGGNMKQLHVARSPNYQYTPDDPLEKWWKWTGKSTVDGTLELTDNINLTQDDPDFTRTLPYLARKVLS